MSVWYYSTGGRQNGPVPQEELVRLVATGSVGPQDLVWREGMSDWKPAGEVPELKPAAAAPAPAAAPPPLASSPGASVNPYQAPAAGWVEQSSSPVSLGDEIVPGSQPLMMGPILSRAWVLAKRHFGLILGVGAFFFIVSFVIGMVSELITLPFVTGHRSNGEAILTGPGYVIKFGLAIASQIFDLFLGLGLTRIGLNLVSGKPAEFGMLFGESRKLVDAVVASILYGLMVFGGLLLLIVPGIYLALRFSQFKCAIIDKDLGAIDALKYSARITEGNKLNLFGFGIVCGLIVLAGILALLVGVLAAGPLVFLANYLAYRWLQYGHNAVLEQSPEPTVYQR